VKYHFGNKDGLLLALLARDAATEVANLEYLLAQPIAPTAKLKLHIGGIIRAYHQFPYMNRLIHYLLHEEHPERPQATNVEFYSAGVLQAIGLPTEYFPPTFAVSRVAGWSAHVLEQSANNRLIRPQIGVHRAGASKTRTAL